MKRFISILLVLMMVLSLAACGGDNSDSESGSAGDGEKATYEWDFLDLDSASHPMVTLMKEWSDKIYEATDGQLKINIRVGGELPFGTSEYLDAVSTGSVEMAGCMITAISGYVQAGGLPSCPYMITDAESFNTVMDVLEPYLADEFGAYGVTNVMTTFYPTQDVYGSGNVPESYKDLKNLKIRTSGGEQSKFWQEVGMIPTSIDASEVSSALNTNIINSVTTATMAVDMNKWYESMDWIYYCNSMIIPVYVVVNDEAFNALPVDVQEAFNRVTQEFQATFTERMIQYSDESLANLESYGLKVVTASDAEKEELRNIAIPLWDEYAKSNGDNAVKALADVKAALGIS